MCDFARCGLCVFMCPPNRCYKRPDEATWAYRQACRDYKAVSVRYAAVTTATVPKTKSWTVRY